MTNQEQPIILIVDDIPTNLGVLFDYLQQAGFKVLVAEDGQDALDQVNYLKPDLILLDVMMPVLDGFETCRRLKDNQETKDIPVIFMTALSETVDKVKGFKVGAVDYVTKPVHAEEVLARVNTHLTIRNLQKDLEQQLVARDKLIAELDAFARTVAHDLKNPLGLIIGYADYLISYFPEMDSDDILEVVKQITQSGQKSVEIIEELLLLAGVRKGGVEPGPLNMKDIIIKAQHRLSPLVEEYDGQIIVADDWPIAEGHGPWIEEVWVNYLSNGLKYGGHPPQLELGATRQENGLIKFWIKDNGPGLTLQAQATLFTEFTRLDTKRREGHGLGLSIVRRIVERLGGEVGVQSQEGEGSEFFFTLPSAE